MRILLASIESEYRRYRGLAEGAIAQMSEDALSAPGPAGGNSVATICWHISGNLKSRFTDFLTSDGEKPWRQRDEEFAARTVSRAALRVKWAEGWDVLFGTLGALIDDDLTKVVHIRGQGLAVHEALHRSLAHTSYHVGQIVYLAHASVGDRWQSLSIPPGGSTAYNANPTLDRPDQQATPVRARET